MANQKWVAVVEDDIIGTFDTKQEAELCEDRHKGRKALDYAIDSCTEYNRLDIDCFINFFISDDKAQTVVNYLQQLIERGVK